MEGQDYKDFVRDNWKGDPIGDDPLGHAVIGLCGEAGELANLYKRRRFYPTKKVLKEDIIAELGDVLFYLHAVALCCGIDMDHVATCNVIKLKERNKK